MNINLGYVCSSYSIMCDIILNQIHSDLLSLQTTHFGVFVQTMLYLKHCNAYNSFKLYTRKQTDWWIDGVISVSTFYISLFATVAVNSVSGFQSTTKSQMNIKKSLYPLNVTLSCFELLKFSYFWQSQFILLPSFSFCCSLHSCIMYSWSPSLALPLSLKAFAITFCFTASLLLLLGC